MYFASRFCIQKAIIRISFIFVSREFSRGQMSHTITSSRLQWIWCWINQGQRTVRSFASIPAARLPSSLFFSLLIQKKARTSQNCYSPVRRARNEPGNTTMLSSGVAVVRHEDSWRIFVRVFCFFPIERMRGNKRDFICQSTMRLDTNEESARVWQSYNGLEAYSYKDKRVERNRRNRGNFIVEAKKNHFTIRIQLVGKLIFRESNEE